MMRLGTLLLSALLLLAGCGHADTITPGGADQEDAVRALNTHLINNDLAAFARAALPSELHAELENAWKAGHTRWPLDEFPLSTRYPQVLATLSAEDARAELLAVFDQQLAGADRDLRQSAWLLSAFMVQFIQQQTEGVYSENERAHYSQLIMAAGQWAAVAPLADREHAEQALDLLIPAARKTGLGSNAAFAEAGMDQSLRRIAPMMAAFKQALALYGLEIDALLADAHVQALNQSEVELRYRLGAHEMTAIIPVEQIEGRWYASDFVRHVHEAVGGLESNSKVSDAIAARYQ